MLNPAIEESFNNKDKAAQMRREIGDINNKFRTIFFAIAQLLEFEVKEIFILQNNLRNKPTGKL